MRDEHRETLAIAAALLVLAALLFWLGRYTAPTRVEEKVRVEKVEVTKEVVVVQEKVRVERVEVKVETQALRRTEHETRKPDGTTETVRTEEALTRTDSAQTEKASVQSQATVQTESSTAETTQTSKVSAVLRPSWMAGVLVGADVPGALAGRPAWVVGGQAAHRLGPLWLGVFGLQNGVVGLSAQLEF